MRVCIKCGQNVDERLKECPYCNYSFEIKEQDEPWYEDDELDDFDDFEEYIEETKKPRKKIKYSNNNKFKNSSLKHETFLNAILILILFAVIITGVLYFIIFNNYEYPIKNYYRGLNRENDKIVLNSYHSCLKNNPGFASLVEQYLKPMKDYKDAKFKFEIKKKTLMKEEALKQEQQEYNSTCGIGKVKIKKAYIVEILQEESLEKSSPIVKKKVTIKVGKINNRWYILE